MNLVTLCCGSSSLIIIDPQSILWQMQSVRGDQSEEMEQGKASAGTGGGSGGWQGWLTGWYSWYGTDATDGSSGGMEGKDAASMFMAEQPTTKGNKAIIQSHSMLNTLHNHCIF